MVKTKYKLPFVSIYYKITIKNAKKLDVPMLQSAGYVVAKEKPCTFQDMCGVVFQHILNFYANLNQWTVEEQIDQVEAMADRLKLQVENAKEHEENEDRDKD